LKLRCRARKEKYLGGKTELSKAYVLFGVASGSEEQVIKDAQKIEGVQETHISYGVYDLVMKIKADNMDQLKELISRRLRKIDNVKSTMTLILTEE
jgi:DNA-binding Lrp family transcriptional regulator